MRPAVPVRRCLPFAVLAITLLAQSLCGAGGFAIQSAPPTPLLVPEHGALLGLFYGAGTMPATDALIGRKPQIHLSYYSLNEDWVPRAASDIADGRIPLISWEPDHVNFHHIVDGSLDATLTERARAAARLGKPLFLDFAAEMNGDEAWSHHDAPLYIAAFRHIHDLFVAAGATNIVWAWCPNLVDADGENARTMDYYPGDAYVDWVGIDGYNWTKYNDRWLSFAQLFAHVYPLLAARGKPILVGEMASAEIGGNKAAWIDGIVPALQSKYPQIKAIVWFDIDKETDWRINSSPASAAAFSRLAKDPYLNP
jgi:hypothetical protein